MKTMLKMIKKITHNIPFKFIQFSNFLSYQKDQNVLRIFEKHCQNNLQFFPFLTRLKSNNIYPGNKNFHRQRKKI